MNIPEGCAVINQIIADGKELEDIKLAIALETDEDRQKALVDLGVDSLDGVEYGMAAEECYSCDCGSGTLSCDLGAFLIRISK